jgi:large subunit ribosomal protein L19
MKKKKINFQNTEFANDIINKATESKGIEKTLLDFSFDSINFIEKKFFSSKLIPEKKNIKVGDLMGLRYLIPEGKKERIQYYQGVIISKQNRGFLKSFTMRRTIKGIGIEQIFLLYSPKLISIYKKQSSKIRRAKLYFLRALTGKKARLKRKF